MSSYGQVTASQIASTLPTSTTLQNAATGNGNGTSMSVTGYATALLSITASVPMGGGTTVNFEASTDNTTWTSIIGSQIGTTNTGTSTTSTGDWSFNIAGFSKIRARISSYGSGTITVLGYVSVLAGSGGSTSTTGSVTQSGTWAVQLLDSAGSNKASISSGGALKIDGSAVTQPISASSLPLPSGAATSAKQPALGTAGSPASDIITVQGIASMTALKIDGSAVTQPISASSLPLPSGAATSAKQPALGTAGSPASDIITVQGIASMTALKVDGSAVTQPISASSLPLPSGAATSAKQPALGTAGSPATDIITVQGIASMTALKVDGSAVTQPISASSLPLPSGAATSAKQPALGTAGSPASDIITVQGIASMTALKVDGSSVTQPVSGTFWQATQPVTDANLALAQNSTTSGQVGPLIQGSVTSSAPSYTNAKTSPLSLTTGGALRVDASGSTVPVSLSGTLSSNISQINGNTASAGNGSSGTGTLRVTIANDSTGQIAQTASIIPSSTTLQSAATANGNGTSMTTTGYATAVLSITASPSMSGGTTINFEASTDGTTWTSILGNQVGTTTTATTTTTAGDWSFSVAGYSQIRARISAYSAGTITVKGYVSVVSGSGGVSAGGGGGGSVNLTQINGNTVSANYGSPSSGTLRVALAGLPMYICTTSVFTPLASATDMAQLFGSSSKTIRVMKVLINYSANTAAVNNTFYLLKRSSANSGGTASTPTVISLDSNNSAATAVVKNYASGSNPTTGTLVGTISTMTSPPNQPGATMTGPLVIYDAGTNPAQSIVLRGTAEGLVVNNNGSTVAGTSPLLAVTFLWTEE